MLSVTSMNMPRRIVAASCAYMYEKKLDILWLHYVYKNV